ncbi:MAG: BsuPI-related putative proteinase inhibitor [Acidimicrobiia bacterium]|nr:BsuPI-related putative proteinase inhibitor [Acidimicrobiia bacterium]
MATTIPRRLVSVIAAVVLAATACGDDAGTADTDTETTIDQSTTAPATTADRSTTAADSGADPSTTAPDTSAGGGGEEAASVGNIWTDGGPIRLCAGLAESFPPGCVEPSDELASLDLDDVVGLTTVEGVTWSDYPVAVVGSRSGTSLMVTGLISPVAVIDQGPLSIRATYTTASVSGGLYWWVVEVRNTGDEPVLLVFNSSQRLDAAISTVDGEAIYTWSADKSFFQAIEELTLEPGSAVSFTANDPVAIDDGDYEVTITATAGVDGEPLPGVTLPISIES